MNREQLEAEYNEMMIRINQMIDENETVIKSSSKIISSRPLLKKQPRPFDYKRVA